MKKLSALLNREFKIFFSNKIMVTLFIGGPILYGVLFGSVYSKGKLIELPVIVVDQDNTPSSMQLIDMLDQPELLHVKEIRQEAVDMGKVFIGDAAYAVVNIPHRFEADMMQGRHPEVNTYINNANLLPSGYVFRNISGVIGTFNVTKTAAMGKRAEALHLNTFRLFNPAGTYFLFTWPSYLFLVLEAVAMVVLALSFAHEQERGGLWEIYQQSNQSVVLLLTGKLVPYLLLSLISLLVYIMYFHFFRQPYPKHVAPLLLSNAIFVMTSGFIGIIAGTLLKSQLRSLQALMILSMPIYISSGFSWPYDQQDGQLAQWFSMLFPYMPSVNALRILLIEQGGFEDIRQYLQIQVLQLLTYFILTYLTIWLNIKRHKPSVLPFTISKVDPAL